MKRGEDDKRKAGAFIRILEGEAILLQGTVDEAIHWDRPSDIRAAVCRIRHKAEQVARALGVSLPEDREAQ